MSKILNSLAVLALLQIVTFVDPRVPNETPLREHVRFKRYLRHEGFTDEPLHQSTPEQTESPVEGTEQLTETLITKKPNPDSETVIGRRCNDINNSTCKLSDLNYYGCCPVVFEPYQCDITKTDDCAPDYKCTKYHINLTHHINSRAVIKPHDLYKCKLVNPYETASIRTKHSRKGPHRLGMPCNKDLYDLRMRPIWEKYLQCPWDPEPYELFQKLKDDWHINHQIMNEVCFSPFIETCGKNNKCACFSKVFLDDEGLVFLNFTQMMEGRVSHRDGRGYCGLPAGSQCTHNTLSMRAGKFHQCRNMPMPGELVPEPFDCERDALCEIDWITKQCHLDKICRCKCDTDFECMGTGSQSRVWVSQNLILSSAVTVFIIFVNNYSS